MRQRHPHKTSKHTMLKCTFCSFLVFLMCLFMILSVSAYFTAKLVSDTLLINVFQQRNHKNSTTVSADVTLDESFTYGASDLLNAGMESVVLSEHIFMRESLVYEMTAESNEIKGYIRLDRPYDPGDIYIPSIRLYYLHNSIPALSGYLSGDALVVAFNQSEVASWFSDWEDPFIETNLRVAGQGYIDGLEPFDFDGSISLTILLEKSADGLTGEMAGPAMEEESLVSEDDIEEETEASQDHDDTKQSDGEEEPPAEDILSEEEQESPEVPNNEEQDDQEDQSRQKEENVDVPPDEGMKSLPEEGEEKK